MGYKLNETQQMAVDSMDSKILCLAGAGTGKTRTMIERIVKLVKCGADPKSILALTFTNAAAFEMRSRYAEYMPNGESPDFRTFHSYCYEILSDSADIRKSLGYSTLPEIADERKQKRIEREAILQSGIKMTQKKMNDIMHLSAREVRDLEILEKCKRRLMHKENLITFDELCSSICSLFIKKDPLVQKYRDSIKYLHVDEYQDTDRTQHSFVMSFEDSANIFLVGDPLQSIYSFRGSVPDIIKSIAINPNWTIIKLTHNYRSTNEICDFANDFSVTYADDSYRIPIISDRVGRPVDCRRYKHNDIFDRIAVECKNFTGSVAILARTNAECDDIRSELDKHDVQYSTVHKELDAKYLLPSVTDSLYMINWLATFLPSEQYSEFLRIDKTSTVNGDSYTERQFMSHFGGNKDIHSRAEIIYVIRGILNSGKSIENKKNAILETIGYPNLNIEVFDGMTVADLISRIVNALDEQPQQESDVYVGTIHSVKGLEYDTVYVMGVNGYRFNLDSEENKNIYYVAITRARDNLVIYS